jgi:hypothetical protein
LDVDLNDKRTIVLVGFSARFLVQG